MIDHDYVNTIVKPTTTSKGYTLHTCKVCKTSYKDNYVDELEDLNPVEEPDTNEDTDSEEPVEKQDGTKTTTTDTSDHTQIAFYVSLMMISFVGMIILKKKYN